MHIKGKLTGAKLGYAGHSVEALIPVKIRVEGSEPASELVLLRSDVADNGDFLLSLESEFEIDGSAEVTVRAPSGERLALVDVDLANTALKVAVKPQSALPVDVIPNKFAASLGPLNIAIKLHDPGSPERVANELVTVWGRPVLDSGLDEPERTILGAAYTDTRGVATIDIARKPYASLEAEVPADLSGRTATLIPLDDNGLPDARNIAVAVSMPPPQDEENDDLDEKCDCEIKPTPRTPDHTELLDANGLYSTDLGGGTCPSPAIPNRTLEEYRFHSLVRTTDPKLFGKRRKLTPLSDTAVRLAGELAYGVASLDARLLPKQSESGSERFAGAAIDSSSGLDNLRISSEAYRNSGLINARAWRDTGDIDQAQKAILERASALSEETLREALADPDGFTPMTLMTAERHAAFDSLARKLASGSTATGGRKPISEDNMPQWDASPKTYQAATIAHGHVLEWRQVWRADGYSLGDLLYSLPLAPGQKRKVVVLDWDRRESGIRSESRTFSESFSADLSHDRAVAEIVNSTVSESIRAGSKTNTWGAGGGIGLGIPFNGGFFGLGVAGGGGGSSSSAWQNASRSLGASAGQQLAERTQQAASAVRSQRATVVVGQEQAETVSVTSEVVANYNHCHALTVEYFEVLKHYRVDQELASVNECLFVPLHMTRFNDMKALRWRDTLQVYLRDRSLRGGFNAIERIVTGYADTDLPPGRYADVAVREVFGEFRIELDIARPRPQREDEDIQAYLDSNWNFWENLFGVGTAESAYNNSILEQDLADQIFVSQLAPQVARAFSSKMTLTLLIDRGGQSPARENLTVDFTMVSDYRAGREHLISFRGDTASLAPFSRAQIKGVEVGTDEVLTPGSTTILRYAQINYLNDYRTFTLVRNRRLRDDVNAGDPAYLSTRTLSRAEEFDPRAHDLILRDGLLKHLNEFIEHYHQIIWWRMDPNRRFMLLDGFIAPNSGNRSVASVTENRLLSIVGNCLVLPVAPGFQLDPTVKNAEEEDEPIDLVEAYRPVIPLPPKRISIPTRGVHAEAIMGECNSCEIIDNTRFWDWLSEPTGDEPPDILETSTSSRRQEPADTTPSDFPAPVVAIQNTPAAPAPTSMSAITGLLSQNELFKDVSGLELNQANALGSFQRAMQTANYFGKLAASGAKASHAQREGERVMKKLQEAEASDLITKDDSKSVARKLFGVMNTDLGGGDKSLPKETSVLDSLRTFLGGGGKKKLTVTQGKGNQTQSVDASFENDTVDTTSDTPVIDVIIEGVAPVHQVLSLGCWAASVTMLRSYQRQQSLQIENVLDEAGPPYPDKYTNNTGLKPSEIADFKQAFGLNDATIGALTPEGLAEQLENLGPLWIVVDENPTDAFSVHARVVTGVKGDGSMQDTMVIYNDPATGSEKEETFDQFVSKSTQLSNGLSSAFGGYSPTILSL
jgi:hypothetical protein